MTNLDGQVNERPFMRCRAALCGMAGSTAPLPSRARFTEGLSRQASVDARELNGGHDKR